MRVDPSGFLFKEIGDWFSDRLDDISQWMHEKSSNTLDSNSSSGLSRLISSTFTGWALGGLEGNLGGAALKYPWTWHNYGNALRNVKSFTGKIGISLTLFTTSLDIVDTWQANNNNNNGQRLMKSLIQGGGTYINYIVAAECFTAIGTALAGGAALISAPVLVPILIIGVTATAVYFGSEYLYNKLDIE